MHEIVIGLLVIIAVVSIIGWRATKTRLRRLEYICLVNSKAVFFYRTPLGKMGIEVTPRSGNKWRGGVDEVYKAFASPTGWESRDRITTSRSRTAKIDDPNEDYKPGTWKE
jgi:hypothetical protein